MIAGGQLFKKFANKLTAANFLKNFQYNAGGKLF
jgi:hypothetical protein